MPLALTSASRRKTASAIRGPFSRRSRQRDATPTAARMVIGRSEWTVSQGTFSRAQA